jgi:GNAT superfamily N-acetyltransferase
VKTYNPKPRSITFDDTTVTVKMMDASWIIDQCVAHSPFIPKQVRPWRHEDRCSRIQIPGDQFEDAMRSFRDVYGNAAVIAWDGEIALGHIIFVPKAEARSWKMLHHERMPITCDDDKTLVVEAVGFCSIGGQKYRRRGIGRAMAEMMIDWSKQNGWTKMQIFGVPSGLFPGHWMDSCMPPRPFWEKFGFEVIGKVRIGQTWEEIKKAHLCDDPRNNLTEMKLKRKIVESIEDSKDSEINWAFTFDMEKRLSRR